MKDRKGILYIVILVILFYNCNNNSKNLELKGRCDCLELKDFDTTFYPISGLSSKPYIDIYKTIKTDSGCIYSAITNIFLDTVPFHEVMIYKKGSKIMTRITEIKSQAFTLFDFKLKINERFEIEINYNDSLKQKYIATLEDKIKVERNEDVYVYRIHDFYFWWHDSNDFTSSMDVVLFITNQNGIIGSYIEAKEIDGSIVMIAPSGNLLNDKIDYSFKPIRVLQ
jgi:hypothetical protein